MHCLRCRSKKSQNPRMAKKNKEKLILSSNYAVCNGRKSRFIKTQEANGLLSNLGLKAPLSKIPLFGDFVLKI